MRSVLGALLLLVAPVLLAVSVDPSTAAVAVVALALATAVLLVGARRGIVGMGPAVAIRPRAVAAVPVRSGGVTDPVHHPNRPRAPEVA